MQTKARYVPPAKERQSNGWKPRFEGWYIVDEAREETFAGFETASMWVKYRIEAGAYPVYSYPRDAQQWNTDVLYVSGEGTIVDDYYENRVFHCSSQHRGEHKGRPFNIRLSFYRYSAADGKVPQFMPVE